MEIKSYLNLFIRELSPLFEEEECKQFFWIALEEIEGKSRIDVVMNPDLKLTDKEQWDMVLEELKKEKPIQYIFGKAYFYGLEFKVNEHTLIPRPETEELVEWVLKSIDAAQEYNIVDLGTGSGCIGVTLGKELPFAQITLMDISPQTLDIAVQNALNNKVKVNAVLQNILALEDCREPFDIVVSNPPYVRNLEKQEIKNNVLNYEPHLALFVEDNDPLLFYRKIVDWAKINLRSEGMLFFEINQYLGEETLMLFDKKEFKDIELKKDMFGNDRMIKAIKR